ncbi:hypothetical protein [Pseudofrankia inefficax]|uniref:Uncharacterized protein n=1 Tax=Pseudofrankia inefficax (strain DSM 45817 / CECT 9037 / DDB 130130 / EuI1c) TaxID=298654 RepID=E3IUH9_PSEI1|nr:hypothetical protein [Pseudofrankia inefficax]ADP83664.1 hypothetical protein FraEuI1c_5680 [Pseudofrankia inefficax]
MDINELDSRLRISNGVFALTGDTIPNTTVVDLLARYTAGSPLTLTGSVKQRTGPGHRTISITGTSSFLNVTGLRTTASFTVDGAGRPQIAVRFDLDTRPGHWRFSTSFPDLPPFKATLGEPVDDQPQPPGPSRRGPNRPRNQPPSPSVPGSPSPPGTIDSAEPGLLDTLVLTDAAFILTSQDGDADGIAIQRGLTFVGKVDPTPFVGPLELLVGSLGSLPIHGPILLPLPTDVTPELAPDSWPWEKGGSTVAGITLSVDLGNAPPLPGTDLSLRDPRLVIYTPTGTTWAKANDSYQPTVGLTGDVTVPSLSRTPIHLTADIPPGWTDASLTATFADLPLTSLAPLRGLVGRADLFGALPASLRSAGPALGGIALRAVRIDVSASGRAIAVEEIAVTVGLPRLSLAVAGVATLTGLEVTFAVASPSRAPTIDLGIVGTGTIPALGAAFELELDVTPGGAMDSSVAFGSLLDATIPLARVFGDLGLPAPADLTIAAANVVISPSGGYELDARLATDPGWTLDLGPVPVTVRDLVLVATKPRGQPTSASLTGQLAFGSALRLSVNYSLPGEFVLLGWFGSTSLRALVAALSDAPVDLPAGFDLQIEQSWVRIDRTGGGLRLTADTVIDGFGELVFTVSRAQGRWGFAAGVDLRAGLAALSAIPGLTALREFESVTGLSDLMIVASSLDDPGFTFPDLAPSLPEFGAGRMRLPGWALGATPGLTVYARADLGRSQGIQTIARWLGASIDGSVGVTLTVSAPDPGTASALFISVATTVDGVVVAGRLGLALVDGRPAVFLDGTATATIQGQPVTFALGAFVAVNGVLITGGYRGTIRFSFVDGGSGLALSDLGLVVGLSWEGIPAFGIAATIDVGTFESSLAVFFDSVDPSRSLLAGSVTELSLLDVATTIAGTSVAEPLASVLRQMALRALDAFTIDGSVAAALDGRDLAAVSAAFAPHTPLPSAGDQVLLVTATPGQRWHVTDLSTMTHYSLTGSGGVIQVAYDPQLYCAPSPTQIGPNTFPRGFHIETAIEWFLPDIDRLRVEIDPDRGIAADLDIAPFVIWRSDFFALTDASGTGGPTLSLATFTQSDATQPDPALRPPHLLVSAAVRLLGTPLGSAYLDVNESGLTVRLVETTASGVRLDLSGTVGRDALALTAGLGVGIGGRIDLGPLGWIDVTTQAHGSLDVGYAKNVAHATVQAGVTLPVLGSLDLPPLSLTVSGTAIGDIGGALWAELVESVKAAVQDAARWLDLVKQGVIAGIAGAEQIGQVLQHQWGLAADGVGGLMHDAGYAADEIATGMSAAGASAEQIGRTLIGFGYATDAVADVVGAFSGHTDFSLGHVDTPQVHTDGHADVLGIGGHSDTTFVPHGDTSTHVDT